MLAEPTTQTHTTAPAFTVAPIISLFAKTHGELYRVELNYKRGDRFILRPVAKVCTAERMLYATAEQLRTMRLFPTFGA